MNSALQRLWPLPQCGNIFPRSEEVCKAGDAWVAEKTVECQAIVDKDERDVVQDWIAYVERRIKENRYENQTGYEAKREALRVVELLKVAVTPRQNP